MPKFRVIVFTIDGQSITIRIPHQIPSLEEIIANGKSLLCTFMEPLSLPDANLSITGVRLIVSDASHLNIVLLDEDKDVGNIKDVRIEEVDSSQGDGNIQAKIEILNTRLSSEIDSNNGLANSQIDKGPSLQKEENELGIKESKSVFSPSLDEPAVHLYVMPGALDVAWKHVKSNLYREVGGAIVGRVREMRNPNTYIVIIVNTIKGDHNIEYGASLTFTADTWKQINDDLDELYNDPERDEYKMVGWYHSHPGFGIFLSPNDELIHNSFFDLPFQLAWVLDPRNNDDGWFGWSRSRIKNKDVGKIIKLNSQLQNPSDDLLKRFNSSTVKNNS